MIKAIIFDCFDVLVGDTTKPLARALDVSDPEKAEEFRAVVHAFDKGIIDEAEAIPLQAALIGLTPNDLLARQQEGEVVNKPLLEYAESLKGRFKLGMLSNISSRERLDIRFEPGVLDRVFDVVVPSGDVGYIKPQPEIFELIADRLGVLPEECLMIDDVIQNCEGARATGMQAVQYISNEQIMTDVNALVDRGE